MSMSAEKFVTLVAAIANDSNLDDKGFRQFVQNTLPIVKGSDYKSKAKTGDNSGCTHPNGGNFNVQQR